MNQNILNRNKQINEEINLELVKVIKKQYKKSLLKKEEALTKTQNFIVIFSMFFAILLLVSVIWIYENTGNVTLEQLIFHLKVPIQGTNIALIGDYLLWTLTRAAIIIGLISIIIFINQIQASTFIEDEYINPSEVNITFPQDKQNLIYILRIHRKYICFK